MTRLDQHVLLSDEVLDSTILPIQIPNKYYLLTGLARHTRQYRIKANLHWRFCPAFSSDVFVIDIYFNQGKFTGKPWEHVVWKIEKDLFFKPLHTKVAIYLSWVSGQKHLTKTPGKNANLN